MKPLKHNKSTKTTKAAPAVSTPAIKFGVGDTVWAMYNNKAVTLSVEGIQIFRDRDSREVRTRYFTSEGDWLDGSALFASKPELLASL